MPRYKSYEERLDEYEQRKAELKSKNLTPEEYERAIQDALEELRI